MASEHRRPFPSGVSVFDDAERTNERPLIVRDGVADKDNTKVAQRNV